MGTWNGAYELQPQNRNNPGYGADAIKSTKKEVRERIDREHIMGDSEATLSKAGGTHREGSARITVTDDFSTSDSSPMFRVSSGTSTQLVEIGNVEINMKSELGPFLKDGIAWDNGGLEEYNKIIEIVMSNDLNNGSQKVKVFDWSEFVNLELDQDIRGFKTFASAPLSEESVSIPTGSSGPTGEEAKKMVRLDEIYNKFIISRDFNVFTDGGVRSDESIYCDEVHATKVFNAVYN